MISIKRIYTALLFFLFVWTGTAHATRQVRLKPRVGQPGLKALLPHASVHRPYTESWSLWAKGDKGWSAYATIFIARMHPFVGTRVGVQLTLISPEGKVLHRLVEFKKEQVYVRPGQLNIRAGKHHITGTEKQGKITVDLKDVGCWLTYTRQLPAYRLFGGDLKVGRRLFQGIPFAPKASIKGFLRWKQQRFRFRGIGYVDRAWQNSPHKIARRWYNARAWSKDYTVLITSMVPAKGWGPGRITGISVAYKGSWLFHRQHQQVRMKVTESTKDEGSGYLRPQSFRLQAALPNHKKLTLQIDHQRLVHRLDVLAHVPKVLRFFVQKLISKPYLFRSQASMKLDFHFNGKHHAVTLPAMAESVFINP